MTLQQLEYIVALDNTRHFVRAAAVCGVTQPTLSTLVRNLEDELDCRIFDRSGLPLRPTPAGEGIIRHARRVLQQVLQLKESVAALKGGLGGGLHLTIIPTVASSLLAPFLAVFREKYPTVSLKISEMQTETIIRKLHAAEIDMAILSGPLGDPQLLEIPLYYEKFVAYLSPDEAHLKKKSVSIDELGEEGLWVLEDGHCLRSQVLNYCESQSRITTYEAGSIENLVKIVDRNGGYTIIPELHVQLMQKHQQKHVRPISGTQAVREISLVVHQDYIREGMMNAVADCVKQVLPVHMLDARLKKYAIRL